MSQRLLPLSFHTFSRISLGSEAILGIGRKSSDEEIKQAYRAKALKWPPELLDLRSSWQISITLEHHA